MSPDGKLILEDLIKRAGPTRRILCGDVQEYFQSVSTQMYSLGLDRRGGGRNEYINGRRHIMDTWVLPDGTTIDAGYPNSR